MQIATNVKQFINNLYGGGYPKEVGVWGKEGEVES